MAALRSIDVEALMKRLGRRTRVAGVSLHLLPSGRWLARAARDRLTAEEEHDAVLAIARGLIGPTVDQVAEALARAGAQPLAEVTAESGVLALRRLGDALDLRGIR